MNTLKTKLTSAVSTAVLFGAAITMTGIGFALVAALAVFAFMALAVALVSAPFVGLSEESPRDADTVDMAA